MINLTRNDEIDFDEYENNIRRNGFVFINPKILNDNLAVDRLVESSLYGLCNRVMRANSLGRYGDSKHRESKYNFLVDYMGVHYGLLKGKTNDTFSLTAAKLQKVYDCGLAREFLEPYFKFSKLKKKNESSVGILNKLEYLADEDNDGNPLGRLHYTVNQQQNFRYNYKDHDVITINKEYSKIISAPKGYILAWGDFSQSDLRIAYNTLLRTEKNFEVVAQHDDMYMGIAHLLALENNEIFDKEKFLAERNLYKTYVLSGIYGKKEQMTEEGSHFMHKLQKFLDNCPKYQEYVKRIEDNLLLDRPLTLESYFGLPQIMLPSRNPYSSPKDKALNTPVQSGTSLVVILVVNYLINKFRALGYTEDDISVYMVRHDEILFLMKEEVMKDAWVLKNTSEILVDDWYPLNMEFEFGYNYKQVSVNEQERYNRICEANKDKLDTFKPSGVSSSDYYPLKPVFKFYIGFEKFNKTDGIGLALYMPELNQVSFLKVHDNADLFDELQKRICLLEQKITDMGYDGVLVYNNKFDTKMNYKQHLVRYIRRFDQNLEIANALAAKLKYSIDKRYDDSVQPDYICLKMDEYMKGIESVNIFEDLEGVE